MLMIEVKMTMVIPFIVCPTAVSRFCPTGMVQMILCTWPEALCQRLAFSFIFDLLFFLILVSSLLLCPVSKSLIDQTIEQLVQLQISDDEM